MLKNPVKVGDKVIQKNRHGMRVVTVEKITSTGNIRTSNNGYFTANGEEKGNKDVYSYCYLCDYDEAVVQEISQNRVIMRVLSQLGEVKTLTYEQAVFLKEYLGLK